ncbi:phosphonate ABC transporter ATP-binding protein [Ursidibacter arcticus]|uniref:phosphonate ABC transporter ATP-binding protein n=1 Tax=Ursidibacter arcticus TaxID=1524965 RepID=UPI0012F817BC|nr:phosphonate ABC transporter ATP-binding protein [Ursidibacter arcticus]KAE9535115.1 ABC transporter ATP-binding protein [Ursidibacter arcticus]
MQPLLSFQQVSKQFDQQSVLDHISLDIYSGEIVAIVGASGSGKSTLMNLIMRSVECSSGQILLNGKSIQHYQNNKQYAQQVGMLHQQYHLVTQLEVIHNVLAGRLNQWGFARSLLSLFKPQEKELALNALKAVGLEDKAYQATTALSGGEQQRVAIARLLVQSPKLILADEPISALDPVNAQKVLALLTGLVREQGKTLIASVHSVEYAKTYFDRMIGIKAGHIVFDQPAQAVTQSQLDHLYGFAKNGT